MNITKNGLITNVSLLADTLKSDDETVEILLSELIRKDILPRWKQKILCYRFNLHSDRLGITLNEPLSFKATAIAIHEEMFPEYIEEVEKEVIEFLTQIIKKTKQNSKGNAPCKRHKFDKLFDQIHIGKIPPNQLTRVISQKEIFQYIEENKY